MVSDRPRSWFSISGRNASPPMAAPATIPRRLITEGRPRAARRVPAGSNRGSAAASVARPTSSRTSPAPRAAPPYCMSAAPTATSTAQPSRRTIEDRAPSGGCSDIGAEARPRPNSSAAGRRSTVTPMKTQRQPALSTTKPVMAGPIMEGTTQAVAKTEKTRGWISAG